MPLEWAWKRKRINDTFLDYRAHLIDSIDLLVCGLPRWDRSSFYP
jgi:hypothetical protein